MIVILLSSPLQPQSSTKIIPDERATKLSFQQDLKVVKASLGH